MNVTLVAVVAGYACACLAIGVWCARRVRGPLDYFLAGRALGPVLLGLSAFASTVTGFAFVGGPALIYRFGASSIWILITGPLGAALAFWLCARLLHRYSADGRTLSLPQVIERRYGSRLTGLLASLVLLTGIVLYLGVQLIALSEVLRGLGLDLPRELLIGLGALVVVAYAALGGTLASIWTDAFQGLLMMAAAVGVCFLVRGAFAGEPGGMAGVLTREDPAGIAPFGALGAVTCLGWFLVFTVGNAGQPHVLRKMMMARDAGTLRRALPLVVLGGTLAAVLWAAVGLAVRALVVSGEAPALQRPDAAALWFLAREAPVWLHGLVLTGLTGAIMSSADAFLNQGALVLTGDLPRQLGRQRPRHPVRMARLATLLLGGAAWWLAVSWQDLLALLGVIGWGLWAAAFVPVLALGLGWPLAHRSGAIASLLVALGGSIGLRTGLLEPPAGLRGDEILLVASCAVFLAVSMLAHLLRRRA